MRIYPLRLIRMWRALEDVQFRRYLGYKLWPKRLPVILIYFLLAVGSTTHRTATEALEFPAAPQYTMNPLELWSRRIVELPTWIGLWAAGGLPFIVLPLLLLLWICNSRLGTTNVTVAARIAVQQQRRSKNHDLPVNLFCWNGTAETTVMLVVRWLRCLRCCNRSAPANCTVARLLVQGKMKIH